MRESLSFKDFQGVKDPENFDVISVALNSAIGYILEADLVYTRELHDALADLSFLSRAHCTARKRSKKLLAMLDKPRYVIHYRNLQQCVKHGLRNEDSSRFAIRVIPVATSFSANTSSLTQCLKFAQIINLRKICSN